MEEFKIDVNTLNDVLGYLGKRPYEEVHQIIYKLLNLKKNKEEEENNGK